MTAPQCEQRYIDEGRAIFRDRFPEGNFDDVFWDIRHLRRSQHNRTNARVYFTKHGSTTDPLPARFADVVKAFLLSIDTPAKTMTMRALAARMLWKAVEKRLGKAHFSWADLCEDDLVEAEQQMLERRGAGTTYKECGMLQRMVDTLAAAPYGAIVRPIEVVFRTPRQEDFDRYTLEGQDLRQAKMPSEEAIFAIGRMFSGLATNERERLVVCALALLLATAFRVGEVLTLPLDCEVTEGSGAEQKYGLRFYKEKSHGGEKRLAVHWLTAVQAELAKTAIAEVKSRTEAARMRARILEQHPDTVPLPDVLPDELLTQEQVANLLGCAHVSVYSIPDSKLPRQLSGRRHLFRASDVMTYLFSRRAPLWVVDLRDGTYQMLSESLFIQFFNAGHAAKAMNPLLVEGLNQYFPGGKLSDFKEPKNYGSTISQLPAEREQGRNEQLPKSRWRIR